MWQWKKAKTINYFLTLGSILFFCLGCSSPSPTGIQLSSQLTPAKAITAPGIAPTAQLTPLGTPVFIASQSSPLQADGNYWVAWRDPELGYVAAAKSGVPIALAEARSNLGRQVELNAGLIANVFQPADTNAVLDVSLTVDIPPQTPPPLNDPECPNRPRVVCDECGICRRLPPRPCSPPPPPEEPPPPITCDFCNRNSWSDPNYRSFDGLLHWTDSEGDFILARTLDGQVEVQARQKRIEGPGDSQNTDMAIRDGEDVLEFNIVLANTAPGLILVNGRQVDVENTSLRLPSGLQVTYSPGAITGNPNVPQLPHFIVQTTTRDKFRVETFLGSLNLSSDIRLKGQYEGILGDADGNTDNDWKPRGGSPISTSSYSTQAYGDFIESWRVTGSQSLFSSPFGDYQVLFTDWWHNSLSPEQMRAGFRLYEELFGSIGDPYFAFRFAVDLAAGIPGGDLRALYGQIQNSSGNLLLPTPPVDADLNRNGIPDVEEERLWNFDNLLNGETGGYLTNFASIPIGALGRVIDLVKSGPDYWVLDEIRQGASNTVSFPRRLLRVTGGELQPVLQDEQNPWPGYSEWFQRMGSFDNGVILLKIIREFNEATGVQPAIVLSRISSRGQSSGLGGNIPLASEFNLGFSNLIQQGNGVIFARGSFPIFTARQGSQLDFDFVGNQDLIQIDSNGQVNSILNFKDYPIMSQFSFPSGTGSNMKLLSQGQDFYFLATAIGEVGPSLLKVNLSRGISVVVSGREVSEQFGDNFVIRDIDLQGSEFVALLTGGDPSASNLLGRVSPQGGITGLLDDAFLGIPVDIGGSERALEATKVIVDGSNYIFSFCEYSNPYSCTLYQYVARRS